MAIAVSFNVKTLEDALDKKEAEAIASGGLDGDDVWYEYLTQEDDRVRPSHAALHGTRWRADDPDAPTPPLDYGCRCFIRYIAAEGSQTAKVLPEAEGPLSSRDVAFKSYLSDHVEGWQSIAKEARTIGAADRLQFISDALIDADIAKSSQAKDIAFMILSVL